MNTETAGGPMHVLMVEDNPDDIFLTKEALADSRIKVELNVVNDGVAALAYLRREQPYFSASSPDLILLDLNLPKKHGNEVLKEIKADRDLKRIPVIILTTSTDENDILETYNAHANCYINKPVDFDHFVRVVTGIKDFWFNTAKLPGR